MFYEYILFTNVQNQIIICFDQCPTVNFKRIQLLFIVYEQAQTNGIESPKYLWFNIYGWLVYIECSNIKINIYSSPVRNDGSIVGASAQFFL